MSTCRRVWPVQPWLALIGRMVELCPLDKSWGQVETSVLRLPAREVEQENWLLGTSTVKVNHMRCELCLLKGRCL